MKARSLSIHKCIIAVNVAGLTAALTSVVFQGTGCSGANDSLSGMPTPPTVQSCTSGTSCTCPDGTPNPNPTAGLTACTASTPPGSGGIKSTSATAAGANMAAKQAMNHVAQLASTAPSSTPGNAPVVADAATAGGGTLPTAPQTGPKAGPTAGAFNIALPGSRNNAGGSGGNSSSAAGLANSAAATAAAGATPTPGPTGPELNSVASGGAGGPEGGGAAAGGPSVVFGGGMNNGGSAEGDGAALAVYGEKTKVDVAAMKGLDPDDYFTRLGLSDNLFRIVEKRYRLQYIAWSQEMLATEKPQGAQPPKK